MERLDLLVVLRHVVDVHAVFQQHLDHLEQGAARSELPAAVDTRQRPPIAWPTEDGGVLQVRPR